MVLNLCLNHKEGAILFCVKQDIAHVLVNTVDSIKNKYTVEEYTDAYKAQSLQDVFGIPSTKDYRYVENNMLPNFAIMKDEILWAEEHTRT